MTKTEMVLDAIRMIGTGRTPEEYYKYINKVCGKGSISLQGVKVTLGRYAVSAAKATTTAVVAEPLSEPVVERKFLVPEVVSLITQVQKLVAKYGVTAVKQVIGMAEMADRV